MSGNPCPECHRQFGEGEACQHCDFTPSAASPDWQLDAVNAARELLRAARKRRNLTVVRDKRESTE